MKLRIALLQMHVEMGNPKVNFAHAKDMMEKAMEKKPDILVLPETWNTGFFPKENLSLLADKEPSFFHSRLPWGEHCRRHHCRESGTGYLQPVLCI